MELRIQVILSVIVVFSCLAGSLLSSWNPFRAARKSGPMGHQAYLWQRRWNGGPQTAIKQAASSLVVLAAEITWIGEFPSLTSIPLDYPALREAGLPIGLCLRIGTLPGGKEAYHRQELYLARVIQQILSAAQKADLAVAELQIDYDSPESKLDLYRDWLRRFRKVTGTTPLTITALPCWLDNPAFGRLVAAADHYVLQVHSQSRPKPGGETSVIPSSTRVRRWVETAANYGVPFRVALPTYSVNLRQTDGSKSELPTDPVAMNDLVRGWEEQRPYNLQSIIWYRLPVIGDRGNWPLETLQAVINNGPLTRKLVVKVTYPDQGLAEVRLVNTGAQPLPAQNTVVCRWADTALIAMDGLGPYEARPGEYGNSNQEEVNFICSKDTKRPVINPGDSLTVGWLRTGKEVSIAVEEPDSL